jgi:putative transcriptional regulator
MTEEEDYQNALDDPDNPPRTADELARMRRVPKPRELRERLGLTQKEFAIQFEIPVSAIRDWEEGIRMPDGTAITYLRVIERNPDALRAMLLDASPVGAATA